MLIGLVALVLCGCKGELGSPCDQATDCKSEFCTTIEQELQVKQCVDECPCDDGEFCFSGAFCVKECEADRDCPSGAGCDAGLCKPVCTSSDDCWEFASCVEQSGSSFCRFD